MISIFIRKHFASELLFILITARRRIISMKQSYTDTKSTQLTRYTEHNYTHTFHTFKIPSVDEKKMKIK